MGNTAARTDRASSQSYAVPIVSETSSRHGSVSDPSIEPIAGRHGSVSDPIDTMSPPQFVLHPATSPGIGLPPASLFNNTSLIPAVGGAQPALHPQQQQQQQQTHQQHMHAGRHLQTVQFRWTIGNPKEVKLMGSFNNWTTPANMTRESDGSFSTTLDLPVGKCTYKFMVDGEWQHDPQALTVPNNLGSVNNVLDVRFADVFLADGDKTLDEPFDQTFGADRSDSPPGDYGTEVPSMRRSKPPPQLPPHLLVVTLNSEPFANDPTQLPEPNHVMLNHLYALSIKDHVMVLGVTHRYRKKFVTSVLYKPVDI